MKKNNYSEAFVVTPKDCKSDIDSSLPAILGTYIVVKWMEIVCAKNINRKIDEKHITVGKEFSIKHIGMAQVGDSIDIISKIEHKDDRKTKFVIVAKLGDTIIAEATHKRVIIPISMLEKLK